MTSTKVEVQELNSQDVGGAQVEEIASYSYTIHEDDISSKGQNGMLIEEFSESQDLNQELRNGSIEKLQVNRGVSIVSISDDDTIKGISRDVSTDDIQQTLEESNGLSGNHEAAEPTTMTHQSSRQAVYSSETIVEERSIDESLDGSNKPSRTGPVAEETQTVPKKQNGIDQSNGSDSTSERSRRNSQKERSLSRQSSAILQERQQHSLEHNDSRRSSTVSEKTGSKQGLLLEKHDSVEYNDSRRNSSIREKTGSTASASRRASLLEKHDSVEYGDSRRSSVLERKSLSRANSILESGESAVESPKASIKSLSRENSINKQRVLTDQDNSEDDEDMKKLFERIKRQRSVLDEILEKKDKRQTPERQASQDTKDDIENGGKFINARTRLLVRGHVLDLTISLNLFIILLSSKATFRIRIT